ncbi:VIT1/CCC1 transporter family protein [Nocardioides massiliensis]|uniref:VIT1/CCC1 family predicted Fe2+/Mn2+ transporter n=1 Tax=Nocardioides massiliensis TaxID=1325935 RepID=A0ABT9NMI3_9ACTN|nr:VIT1/CCC1 transporter family protein [Nocardioides massiliensis]MDP9821414.1 VIT1/CCC1 family predicted Fe2+/Mn2+ transporter [Nocardioides massiliensis]
MSTGLPHVAGHEHPDVAGGWLRPAVFGAMDGLVSNVALIAGVAAGASTAGADQSQSVLLAGLAGLSAGALSMAAGEYTSVASQSEAAQREIAREREEIRRHPAEEVAELAARLEVMGVDTDLADRVADQIHRDPEIAVTVHARQELGISPDDLASPTVAAVSSFLSFAVGAAIPLLPWLLGVPELWLAVALTLVALFACGAVVAQVTVRSWWYGGLRQALLGGVAAAATYGLGALVGVGLG